MLVTIQLTDIKCQATPDKVIGNKKWYKISSTILQHFSPGKQIL